MLLSIDYLQHYGEVAKDAIPILEKLKFHEEKLVRDAATKALELIESSGK